MHKYATKKSLRLIQHLIIGPTVKPRSTDRDSGARISGCKECDDDDDEGWSGRLCACWRRRADDINIGKSGKRETNLQHLETNGQWNWASDPTIVDL